MTEELIKAIFAAGFRTGIECGEDSAFCYERGYRSSRPQQPEKAWEEFVAFRLASDSGYPLDVSNPESWRDIP
jgi:hypothetical protein